MGNMSVSNITTVNNSLRFESTTNNDEPILDSDWCNIVMYIEIVYQILFFCTGAPINIWSLQRDVRCLRARTALPAASAPKLCYLSINLTLANLIILCIHCCTKTGWQLTYWWYGGDVLCKLYSFFSTLGYYLFSNSVVLISLDMFCCVKNPFKNISEGIKRTRIWLAIAWLSAVSCAAPQLVFFGTFRYGTALQ